MQHSSRFFHRFNQVIDRATLPKRFNYPFKYRVHPLCELAANEVFGSLKQLPDCMDLLGLSSDKGQGRLFGVLLVENDQNEIGYLTAYEGQIVDVFEQLEFVPPIVDHDNLSDALLKLQQLMDAIQGEIKQLQQNISEQALKKQLAAYLTQAENELNAFKQQRIESRKDRKLRRILANKIADQAAREAQLAELAQESIDQNKALQALEQHWQQHIQNAQVKLSEVESEINDLEADFATLKHEYDVQFFERYQLLNSLGETQKLNSLFEDVPVAGTGDCVLPKLLQHAFKNQLTPLNFAEFWLGKQPNEQVRHHLNFYPVNRSRCESVLPYMLKGLEIDENQITRVLKLNKKLQTLYQDEHMVVLNKPSGMLSVPGKEIDDSVYTRIKQQFPEATGGITVHRLDMYTSGVIVVALNKAAHKYLQQQFINRTVTKRYFAVLDGVLEQDKGTVNLPLRTDFEDRPRQVVCYQYGKDAETSWEVVGRTDKQTQVNFYPKTGRTHQIRVHAAHKDGLNIPLVGDELYGKPDKRLYLHAETLVIKHPVSHEKMVFQVDPNF